MNGNDLISGVESSLNKFKNDIIEWMFLLWIAQVVVLLGVGMILKQHCP